MAAVYLRFAVLKPLIHRLAASTGRPRPAPGHAALFCFDLLREVCKFVERGACAVKMGRVILKRSDTKILTTHVGSLPFASFDQGLAVGDAAHLKEDVAAKVAGMCFVSSLLASLRSLKYMMLLQAIVDNFEEELKEV